MKLLKNKKLYILIGIIIGMLFLINILLKIYVGQNYDVKVITDRGGSFFIFSITDRRYYLINSSLGMKVETQEFEKDNELTTEQLENLQKITQLDNEFTLKDNEVSDNDVFFCDDYIFYTHDIGSYEPKWYNDNEEFYKYNIKTNDIEKIKTTGLVQTVMFNLKLESLLHLYPGLKDSIDYAEKNKFELGEVYYQNGRIFFEVYYVSTEVGKNYYLYEYIPSSNKTKKIIKLNESIVDVEILK